MVLSLTALQTRALVLDIEGTTTPVEFVYQVLFPFARREAADYLRREGTSDASRAALELLRAEQASDPHAPRETLAYIGWLMDQDRKSPGLKALQGLVWQEGYRRGQLRGEVYPDVAPAFRRWRAAGRKIYIYSSGSVLAQQLLFGSTADGDLTAFLDGYFDTSVGAKSSADSYHRIAQLIRVPPPEILFVSDVVAELDAAKAAGFATALCVRASGAECVQTHPVVHAFDAITG